MKHFIYIISILTLVLLFTSCAKEFNAVYKSTDYEYRYEYAKELFAKGKYTQASLLFGDMLTITKGKSNAEECAFLYGMSSFYAKDYESAAEVLKKYYTTYPKGIYAEDAYYYTGECLYRSVPEVRLDQSTTYQAMKAFQDFMDVFPYSNRKSNAENKLYELQDKLVEKELVNARLYYNLGTYFGNCTSGGNNYEACIVTAQNAIKDYPFTKLREEFATLIMKSKYELALHSVREKQTDRFQDALEECYGFINEYPTSKEKGTAEKLIDKCKKYVKGETVE